MPPADIALAWHCMEFPSTFADAAGDTEMRIEMDKVRMMDKLAIEKNRFDEELDAIGAEVKRAQGFDDYANEAKNVEDVNGLQDRIAKAYATQADFNAREKVFTFPPTEYPQLRKTEQELQPFLTLWNMVSEFHTRQQEWLYGPFLELNGQEIQKDVEDWWRVSRKLIAQLEEGHEGASLCSAELHREPSAPAGPPSRPGAQCRRQ